jgi:hypothetical protein
VTIKGAGLWTVEINYLLYLFHKWEVKNTYLHSNMQDGNLQIAMSFDGTNCEMVLLRLG